MTKKQYLMQTIIASIVPTLVLSGCDPEILDYHEENTGMDREADLDGIYPAGEVLVSSENNQAKVPVESFMVDSQSEFDVQQLEAPKSSEVFDSTHPENDVYAAVSQLLRFDQIRVRGDWTENTTYHLLSAPCTTGWQRDYYTIDHSGHGNCGFDRWQSPHDPTDCSLVYWLKHSAGGPGVWNGECRIWIYEKSERGEESCVSRCDGQAPSGCWCDSACLAYDDCCPDFVRACTN